MSNFSFVQQFGRTLKRFGAALRIEMTNTADFISALENIGNITSDPVMANTARSHARRLAAMPPKELEAAVKSIRDELDYYKSDFRDSPDQSDATRTAIKAAYQAAKQTINNLIRTRQSIKS